MIFDMVIYVTLINLKEMECIVLLLKNCILLCLCVLEYLTSDKSKVLLDKSKAKLYCKCNFL